MEDQGAPCQSPAPSLHPPNSSLRDISNFRGYSLNPNLSTPQPQFFTASKQTPRRSSSFRRPSLAPRSLAYSSIRSKTARRLKAFELEQSQSSRKEQLQKERRVKAFAKSVTTWLNFLFENPGSCGCNTSINGDGGAEPGVGSNKAKRDSGGVIHNVVGVEVTWRSPKRLRDWSWRGEDGLDAAASFPSSKYSALRDSLKDVCSLDDLKQRMRIYLSLGSCKEIFDVMTRVAKNIDDGRFKMKSHCPVVTDFGMKEKAIRTLMCYNPIWLRIGLYIVFGGDSLLSDVDMCPDQEMMFLKMVIQKQFFAHAGLAKAYAYNKMVDGLFRPGYYEALGVVILKRFLLLVLVLDRAKSKSSISLKYGLDGIDGGSPLLFLADSSLKSSHQVIQSFLSSDAMHGEGNILAHLVTLGYKTPYQQCPLVEFDFRVTDLFADLRDGVRLCRTIQLLLHDPSILMRIGVQPDSRKKSLANCEIALEYLTKAGVSLQDDEGVMIMAEDIVNGDKELILSLLWNIFVYLQLPLLINKTAMVDEIHKISGPDLVSCINISSLPADMLLNWVQAICEKYESEPEGFSAMVDGKAIWCVLDYYFRREICCSCVREEVGHLQAQPIDAHNFGGSQSVMSQADYANAVHNFILSQKLAALLGNFPEVLQIGDLLEHNAAISDRSVIILLAFLSSKLTVKENMDQLNFHKLLCSNCQALGRRHSRSYCGASDAAENRDESDELHSEAAAKRFKAIQAWWQKMSEQNGNNEKATSSSVQRASTNSSNIDIQKDKATRVIQSNFRGRLERRRFLKILNAVSLLQTVIRAWLTVKHIQFLDEFSDARIQLLSLGARKKLEEPRRYVNFIFERHCFIRLRASALFLQQAARAWMYQRRKQKDLISLDVSAPHHINACVSVQEIVSNAFLDKELYNSELEAAHKVQLAWRDYHQYNCRNRSAIIIQAHVRGWISRKRVYSLGVFIRVIQRYSRGWLVRRQFLAKKQAAIKIQMAIRCFSCMKLFQNHKQTAIVLQRFIRGRITRKRLLGASCLRSANSTADSSNVPKSTWRTLEMSLVLSSVLKIQRWWKGVMSLKRRTASAVVIQGYIRKWIVKQRAYRERHHMTVIERYIRGWLVRREFSARKEAAIKIQTAIRCICCMKLFGNHKHAAVVLQRFVRGHITRKRLLGTSRFRSASFTGNRNHVSEGTLRTPEMNVVLSSVLKIQRWWKGERLFKKRTASAIVIQSHVRKWMAKRRALRERHHITVIQSHWKGYLARKESKAHLMELRLRMQKSAANVDDKKRLINKLLSALSELLNMKHVHNILHICEVLDTATRYSEKCCEELVAAGAIDKLLTVIRSASRSIPDQEVSKHALSTLRNLARHQHLIQVLLDSNGSIQTIFWELLRSKDEGYFTAAELLKSVCSDSKGVEAVRKLPAFVKRLLNLVEELQRKATIEKRNVRLGLSVKENTERRLKVATDLLKRITSG